MVVDNFNVDEKSKRKSFALFIFTQMTKNTTRTIYNLISFVFSIVIFTFDVDYMLFTIAQLNRGEFIFLNKITCPFRIVSETNKNTNYELYSENICNKCVAKG